MSALTWIVRLAVALMFAIAGLAKFADQAGARRTARGLGVPAVLAPAAAIAVSVVELAVAVGLIFDPTGGVAAFAGLALLVVFSAGLTLQLARGNAVPCACFGQITSTPAGLPTLARNAVLAIATAFLVARLA